MKISYVAATSSIPPQYRAEHEARREAMKEYDSLIVSEDSRTLLDWAKQFRSCFMSGQTEDVFSAAAEGGIPLARDLGGKDPYAYGADIYLSIKSQIDAKYGGDGEKQRLFTMALDDAFESFVSAQTWHTTRHLAMREEVYRKYGSARIDGGAERNPLTAHKDFDADEFYANIYKSGKDFVEAFTQGAKKGAAAAWENVGKLLGGMQTSSVNRLSFQDMRVLMQFFAPVQDDGSGTAQNWQDTYALLADNNGLSDFMRSIFKDA